MRIYILQHRTKRIRAYVTQEIVCNSIDEFPADVWQFKDYRITPPTKEEQNVSAQT